jgi:hypothetical protein
VHRPDPPSRTAPDYAAIDRALTAELQAQYLRGLRLASQRWLAAASLPVWIEVHTHLLPGLLAWFAFLAQGGCLALAAGYAALEYRWASRATQLEPGSSKVVVHIVWTAWDELRSALWYGLALVSLVPWAYVGLERPLPASLLSALTATAWTVLLLLGVTETLARLRPGRGPDGGVRASGRVPLTWVGPDQPTR